MKKYYSTLISEPDMISFKAALNDKLNELSQSGCVLLSILGNPILKEEGRHKVILI